ncbi:MAG: hypothetical protein AAF292_05245 [Pseudomonadota bacterium]
MPRLFDAYIMVDWSAATKPVTGPNSIWIGILAKDARLRMVFQAVNPETRLKARKFLEDIIGKLQRRGDRILLGFDFSLGYPDGTAEAVGLDIADTPPWRAIHSHIASKMKEREDNSNPRFAVAAGMNYAISKGPFPFWGAPKREQVSTLAGTKGDFGAGSLAEFRLTESWLKEQKLGQPKSCWQLAYTGSVGSQSLTGIPHVKHLRDSIPGTRIWPFETGLQPLDDDALQDVKLLICEVYPSAVPVTQESGEVLDRAQVRTIAHHYCDLDIKGRLGGYFGAPDSLDEGKVPVVEGEEGWILAK